MSLKLTVEEKRKRARDYALRRTYGISTEQFEQLLEHQGGNCYVCQRHASTFPKSLAVDHDHKTGEIRGLLCTYCNHRMVGRHREPDTLQRVVNYIRGPHTGWFVPKKRKKRVKRKKS